jgi:hypothetical protein
MEDKKDLTLLKRETGGRLRMDVCTTDSIHVLVTDGKNIF